MLVATMTGPNARADHENRGGDTVPLTEDEEQRTRAILKRQEQMNSPICWIICIIAVIVVIVLMSISYGD